MKKFLVALATMICGMFLVVRCTDDCAVKGSTTFYGKVVVNPLSAKQNENVSFSIGGYTFTTGDISADGTTSKVDVSTSTIVSEATVNGKNVVKSVSYFVDGTKVAESSDKDGQYAVSYRVENLSVGKHVVTAKCSSNFKKYTIEEHIIQGELTVE